MTDSRSKAHHETDVLKWVWPEGVNHITSFDKYLNQQTVLSVEDSEWTFPIGGQPRTVTFPSVAHGRLQRVLAILSQRDNGPAALYRFGTTVSKQWAVFEAMLGVGAKHLRDFWETSIHTIACANTGKAILTQAAKYEVGPWRVAHLPLIRSLDSKSKEEVARQRAKITNREHLLPLATQLDIIRMLDEASHDSDLNEDELKGLSALLFMFQHAMRPVQLIVASLRDTYVLEDASGDFVCTVTFHAAKRGKKKAPVPLSRAAWSEWANIPARLFKRAVLDGRDRLFGVTTAEALQSLVKKVCKKRGFEIDFRAGDLRHSALQNLADSGAEQETLADFMGQVKLSSSSVYFDASAKFGERINAAVGASAIYKSITALADKKFLSMQEMLAAPQEEQIGALVGDRLVAGIGLCKRKQTQCVFDPVISCYGCSKHMPSEDIESHLEAIAGMRAQEIEFSTGRDASAPNPSGKLKMALQKAQELVIRINSQSPCQ